MSEAMDTSKSWLSASTRSRRAAVAMAWLLVFGVLFAASGFAESSDATNAVDVVFVLDNSGSMRQNDPAFLTRTAVLNFADALADDVEVDGRIAIVLFDDRARVVQSLTPAEKGHASGRLSAPLATLDFSGQRTNGPTGIERALYELREHGRDEARKAIIFLTDGKIDTGSREDDLEAGRWLREDLAGQSLAEGIRIFGVAFTEAADYQLMQALALKTRASYYRAFQATELDDVINDVLAQIAKSTSDALATDDASPAEASADLADVAGTLPAVASAPAEVEEERFNLFGWLPIALFLAAGALFWRYRRGAAPLGREARAPFVDVDPIAPDAQLLDAAGHFGEAGGAIALGQGQIRIGRDRHNDIVLDNDAISSEHAIIEVRRGRYWLEDLRSTNGTYVGEERLTVGEPVQLKGGDAIRFGELDVMFALTGYLPGGATVFLNPSTTPDGWTSRSSLVDETTDESDASLEDETDMVVDPAGSVAVDRPAISLLPSLDDERPSLDAESPADEAVAPREHSTPGVEERHADRLDTPADVYRGVLDFHLERVEELSSELSSFVLRGFDSEMRSALSVAAGELLEVAHRTQTVEQKSYTAESIRYLICAVPDSADAAREQFAKACGGFTRLLTNALQDDSFLREGCEILAVLTFGQAPDAGAEPWVSLSIVPDEGQEPQIDLLSYEFLTDDERREIEPHETPGESQLGGA